MVFDFKKAIGVAERNARELVPQARDFALEGVILSGRTCEVTLSYYLEGESPLELAEGDNEKRGLIRLAQIMGTRRETKVFMIDKHDFTFKGFKACKEG